MKNIFNKVAAITGAGSGIGRALAINLAQEGCHLALSDINKADVAETAKMLKGYPVKVTHIKLDVSDKKEMFAWADQVVAEHGKVNLIFNNAGVGLAGTVESTKMEDFEWIMGVNFWGVVYGVKAFLPYLKAAEEGHIVNIASIFGLTSQPIVSGYNASKFAVRGFTESLSQELEISDSKDLRVTCVYPGFTKTNLAKTAHLDSGLDDWVLKQQKAVENLVMSSAETVAKTILKGVKNNKSRVLTGPDAYVVDYVGRLMPVGYQTIFSGVFSLIQKTSSFMQTKKRA